MELKGPCSPPLVSKRSTLTRLPTPTLIDPSNPEKKHTLTKKIIWSGNRTPKYLLPRHEPCCHVPTPTVAGYLLRLCLWVPSSTTGQHARSGYRLLRNSRKILMPVTLIPLFSVLRSAQYHRANIVLLQQHTNCTPCILLTLHCFRGHPQLYWLHHAVRAAQLGPMYALQSISCNTSTSSTWRCDCSKPAVIGKWQ